MNDVDLFSTEEGKFDFLNKYLLRNTVDAHDITCVELFTTAQGKYDFLQRYVTKYKSEFSFEDGCYFNRMTERLSKELWPGVHFLEDICVTNL